MTDYTKRDNLNIAVVGSGISGICTAYLLQHRHKVTLIEKNSYFGGHTHTLEIPRGPDRGTPVDTGFIVLNQRTYPNFIKFLSRLGVVTSPTDMSFSYHDENTGLCYASCSLNTLFAQRANLLQPRYLRFVYEMVRYLGMLRKEYLTGSLPDITLEDYLRGKGLHREVRDWFVLPMAAAIWSGSDVRMGRFPVRTFAQFYENHGLLGLTGHPPWFYIEGGSHTYVRRFLEGFTGQALENTPVTGIQREGDRVTLRFENQAPREFDAVVLATHADQALSLLDRPGERESSLLGAWTYSRNRVVLHTDEKVMPPERRAWASWNYIRYAGSDPDSPVTVSYDMTRLQRLNTSRPYFVTLNPGRSIPSSRVIREMDYTHPQYDFKAFNSQKGLAALNGENRTFFCGAYFGYGFHEDGVKSALGVAEQFGVTL